MQKAQSWLSVVVLGSALFATSAMAQSPENHNNVPNLGRPNVVVPANGGVAGFGYAAPQSPLEEYALREQMRRDAGLPVGEEAEWRYGNYRGNYYDDREAQRRAERNRRRRD
jgi:hypothetical protein